jgi:hypothetical protein
MRRRKLLVALAVGLMALVGFGAFVAWPRPNRVTRQSFDRIELAMRREEVYAILGPPADYRTGPATYHSLNLDPDFTIGILENENAVNWVSDQAQLMVNITRIDGRDLVTGKAYWSTARQEQGPLDNLLWRAKRQWRKCFPE